MSYRLDQYSTPAWAAQGELDLNPSTIPAYFRSTPQDPLTSPSQEHHTRWSDIRQQVDQPFRRHETGGIDSGLLEKYSLNEKWQDELDDTNPLEKGPKFWLFNRHKMRRTFYKLLRSNPFVPFTLRGLSLVFAISALGFAARIFVLNKRYPSGQKATTILTIVIETIAVVYLSYTIYDEFFGKPLGLRTAKSKITFVLCDIVLTIFTSAILALAFDLYGDSYWACGQSRLHNGTLCNRQRDLVALIFVSLVSFLFTFLVSTYRMMATAAH